MARRRPPTAAAPLPAARPPRAPSDRGAVVAIAAGLAAVVLALYAQTGHFEFVTLDDYDVLLERPIVRRGLSMEGVTWALTAVDPNWHPLTWFSHMLDFSLFGATAGPQHLVNAGLHATDAILLFLALRALTGALWPSALAAALFAVHPLRVESVAWVTERKDVMSGLFFMLTLLAYAWYVRRPAALRYAVVAGAVVLGLMSKTMLVSLPIVLLLLDAWPLQRWHLLGTGRADAAGRCGATLGWLVAEKLPLLALAAAASVLTVVVLQGRSGLRSAEEVPLAWRLVNAPIAYVTYLRQTLWPVGLGAMYPHPAMVAGTQLDHFVWPAIGATVLLASVSAVCAATAPTRPYLAVGWLWFLLTLLPVIGLVQAGMQAYADRFTYLPMIGVYVMIAWGGRDLAAHWPRSRSALAVAALAALVGYAVVSWVQIGTWRNSETLWERAIAAAPESYVAHAGLGVELRRQGRVDEATQHFLAALRIHPQEPFTLMQYGTLLQDQGQLDEAARYHEEALRYEPGYAQAYANLGVVRLRQHRLDEAEATLGAALQLKPDNALTELNLGEVLLEQKRFDDAGVHLRRALALGLDSAEVHNNLGVVLAQQGRLQDAASEFAAALRANPGHTGAQRNLAQMRERLGS